MIIGGGYIGLEMAEALIRRGIKVKLVEFFDHILTTVDSELGEVVKNHLEQQCARIFVDKKVEHIGEKSGMLEVSAGAEHNFSADMVLVAVGALPETSLARGMSVEIEIQRIPRYSRDPIAKTLRYGSCQNRPERPGSPGGRIPALHLQFRDHRS